jgi:hypothetical protein
MVADLAEQKSVESETGDEDDEDAEDEDENADDDDDDADDGNVDRIIIGAGAVQMEQRDM